MKTSEAVRLRVEELCREKGMSLYALAYRAGMPESTLKSVMRGKSNNPGILTLYRIADGFGMGLKSFFLSPLFSDLEDD